MTSALDQRIVAILGAEHIGAVVAVRTSDAFAARFRAEAERSGLSIDLEEKSSEQMVRVCPVCGAQNGRGVTSCFNCQSDLAEPPPVVAVPRSIAAPRHQTPEARYVLVCNSPRVSTAPLVKLPIVRSRFEAQLKPITPIDHRSIADRFLSVFVEKSAAPVQHAGPGAERFDDRSVLDKFLSVFVERQ